MNFRRPHFHIQIPWERLRPLLRWRMIYTLAIAIPLLLFGLISMAYIVNHSWVVPDDYVNFSYIQRQAATDQLTYLEIAEKADQTYIFLFLLATFIAGTGFSFPFTHILHRYLRQRRNIPPAYPFVPLRQAFWCGLTVASVVYLQILRAFGLLQAILIIFSLAAFELWLGSRKRPSSPPPIKQK